ncbi:SusC/RagA family TonB-linked outer membrane protein [Adhaeribacter aerolatus]|uniref:SusC/RagA family TonB-linked outer membrane protein n=1 Tax=Adhaeribacter aerolatus TaxID=670289 RepID=A0A512B590_9BACT|nr:TonB-dependent receptor [Adhaeribacter aerolatus]GEO07101.1 SusC/RagA family TonB-linked outer membrane protein [Adhaeribacter aerolatus]
MLLVLGLQGTPVMGVYAQHLAFSNGAATATRQEKTIAPANSKSIIKVLGELEAIYKVSFNYNSDQLEGKFIKNDLLPNKTSLEQTLKLVLRPFGLKYEKLQNNFYLIYAEKPTSQNLPIERTGLKRAQVAAIDISGKVVDEAGAPLPGVSILVKGTSSGTATDATGNFTLSVPSDDAVLIFSFIGFMSKEIAVNKQTVINVTLVPDAKALEEVVVVGYGVQKKSVVTGAISSVKATELENQQIGRVEQALQGRTSGLTIASSSGAPGAASSVRVRGATSLNDANDPLYVVDGVVVGDGGINYLNPNDIESIEVLKDAASAAIYGARSSAGVILVTTKRGKTGTINVNYNAYYGTQAPARKLDLLDATQYATLINEQSVNGGGKPVYTNPESLGKGTDWQSLIFNNNARIQDHQVNISGGSEKSTFYTSFGYFGQEGIVATDISKFNRYSIRLNSNHKLAKWLSFGQSLGYSRVKSNGGVGGNTDFGGPLSGAIMLDPLTPVIVTDPTELKAVPYATQAVVRDAQGNPYGISKVVQQQVTNPLAYIQTQKGNYDWADNIVGNAYVEAEPLAGLKIRSTLGARLNYWGSENFTPLYYLNANQFSIQTSFARNRRQLFNWNLENTASYSRSIGNHNFTILLGQGAYLDNNSSGLTVTYFNLPVDNFDDASMNYSTAADNINATGSEGIHHTVSSLFSRLTYNLKEKYLFTGIIRRDGSSRFGANNKYGYFPSASLGWVLSQEDFLAGNNQVNFLKLRGSYGITGNDVLGDFRYISTVGGGRNYTFGNDNYLIGYSPDAPANPNLRWEETSQLNFGVDAVLLQDWTLTLDWYKKKTTGILQTVVLPAYVGATGYPYGNVADMENRGVELELGYRKQVGALKLDVRGNVSYLENEVTYLGEDKTFLEDGAKLQNSSYLLTRTALGHAIGSFYGFQTQGIFQNQGEIDAYIAENGNKIQPKAKPGDFRWADLNQDGQITADDRTFIGDPTPNWSYGFTFNTTYKNFDLLAFGQGVGGNQIFQGLRRLDIPTANWQTNALNRWNGEGTSDTYPRLTTKDDNKNFANPSAFYLQSGNYLRIKTLQLGYSLTKETIGKVGLQRLRVYVSSNNLLTFTKYTGFDPEIGGNNMNNYSIDRGIYPQSRSFLLGLNVGF